MEAAVCYSQTSTVQKEEAMKLLAKLNPKQNDCVLDLGCGTGYIAKVVAERVGPKGKVIAVDPDEARIEVAQKDVNESLANLQFMVRNDQTFPQDEKYDIVVSTSVVHWIKDKEAAFKNVYDSLKPGGSFGYTTQDDPQMPEVLLEMLHLCGPQTVAETANMIHWESAEYYKKLAKSIGFEVTFMEIKNVPLQFPDFDSFVNFFYGVFHGKFDRTVPAIKELKKQYEGQSLTAQVPRLTVILTKSADGKQ